MLSSLDEQGKMNKMQSNCFFFWNTSDLQLVASVQVKPMHMG
jgi:prenyltransferase beta subunit